MTPGKPQQIVENLAQVQARIESACHRVGRSPKEVKLVLATKTVPAELIAAAIESGYPLIAENRIQELKEKFEPLQAYRPTSHFIGHLQTNKVKHLLRYGISCLQSLDRLDLAKKLHERLSAEGRAMDVLIQVNTSREQSKFGVEPANARTFVSEVAAFDTLRVKGLMTIGLLSEVSERTRSCFRMLKGLKEEIQSAAIPGVDVSELSMGMSGDLEIAIEEGATIVRVGTAVFGRRATPDSFYWKGASGR